MPYINPDRRAYLDNGGEPLTAGELNYLVSRAVIRYVEHRGRVSYQDYNDMLGALEGAKLELYRRVVAPFEDQALTRNGDIYPVPLHVTAKGLAALEAARHG